MVMKGIVLLVLVVVVGTVAVILVFSVDNVVFHLHQR